MLTQGVAQPQGHGCEFAVCCTEVAPADQHEHALCAMLHTSSPSFQTREGAVACLLSAVQKSRLLIHADTPCVLVARVHYCPEVPIRLTHYKTNKMPHETTQHTAAQNYNSLQYSATKQPTALTRVLQLATFTKPALHPQGQGANSMVAIGAVHLQLRGKQR